MKDPVLIPLPIDADLVGALQSDGLRAQLGHIVSGLLRAELMPALGSGPALMEAIGRVKVHAHMHGLTDALLLEELQAYNGEGRE